MRFLGKLFCAAGCSLVCSVSNYGAACDCDLPRPQLLWPEPGATAPSDTTIVIDAGTAAQFGAAVQYRVEAADGTQVEVEVVRTLKVSGDCQGEAHFLRPRNPLAAGGYRVVVGFGGDASAPYTSEFAAGSERRGNPTTSFAAEYVRALAPIGCSDCTEIAEVELRDTPRTEPTWAILDGTGPAPDAHKVAFLGRFETTQNLAVSVWRDEPCVDIDVIDVSGRSAGARRLCAPSKCVVSNSYSRSSCGGVVGLGADYWAARSPGGCEQPVPPPRAPDGSFFLEPATDGGSAGSTRLPDGASPPSRSRIDDVRKRSVAEAGGCSASLGDPTASCLSVLSAACAGILASRRRRRSRDPQNT